MHEFDQYDLVEMNGRTGVVVGLFLAGNYLIRFPDGTEVNSFKKKVTLVRREGWLAGKMRCLIGKHRMHFGMGSNVSGSCARGCGHSEHDWS